MIGFLNQGTVVVKRAGQNRIDRMPIDNENIILQLKLPSKTKKLFEYKI